MKSLTTFRREPINTSTRMNMAGRCLWGPEGGRGEGPLFGCDTSLALQVQSAKCFASSVNDQTSPALVAGGVEVDGTGASKVGARVIDKRIIALQLASSRLPRHPLPGRRFTTSTQTSLNAPSSRTPANLDAILPTPLPTPSTPPPLPA